MSLLSYLLDIAWSFALLFFCIRSSSHLLQYSLAVFRLESHFVGPTYVLGLSPILYEYTEAPYFFLPLMTGVLSLYVFSLSYNLPGWLLDTHLFCSVFQKVVLQLMFMVPPLACFLHALTIYWGSLLLSLLGVCTSCWLQSRRYRGFECACA